MHWSRISRIGRVLDEVRLASGFVGLTGAFVKGARPLEPAGLGAGRTDPTSTRAVVGVCVEQSLSHPGLGLDQGDQRVGHFGLHRGLGRGRRGGFPADTRPTGATAIVGSVDQAKAVGRDRGAGVCCRAGSGRRGDDGLVGHWAIRPPMWRGGPHGCPTRTTVHAALTSRLSVLASRRRWVGWFSAQRWLSSGAVAMPVEGGRWAGYCSKAGAGRAGTARSYFAPGSGRSCSGTGVIRTVERTSWCCACS